MNDRIFFLGSGDAFCHDGRANQAILVERAKDSLLLDCGPTTKLRFKQSKKDLSQVNAILITHFHGDHLAGLPFCLLHWHYEERRSRPLHLIGPEGLKKALSHLVQGTYANLLEENQYPIYFHELPRELHAKVEVDDFEVTAFPMKHVPESLGLRLRWKNGDIAITGDTCWNENIPKLCDGTDMVFMECSSYKMFLPEIHLSYEEIRANRSKLNTGQLILHHMDEEMIDSAGDPSKVEEITACDGFSALIRPKKNTKQKKG